MQTLHVLSLVAVGLGICVPFVATGCAFFDAADDCERAANCAPGIGASSSSSSSTGGHVNCDPAMGAVDGSCGVFVSSSMGDDKNAGSESKPLKTLGAGLTRAGAGRVYACGENFTETVKVSSGVTLYGALDCSNGWAYDASKRTVVTASPDAIPLTLASTAMGVEMFDFAITAADATTMGGSSIAAVVDHATATFTRCSFVAGSARDGEAGLSGGMQLMPADPGLNGKSAGTMGSSLGGAGGDNMSCNLLGGNGGNGGSITNGPGQDGQAGDNGNGGAKGSGDTGTGCADATKGTNGIAGPAGPVMSGIGTIDASGYYGIDGQAGMDGTNGTSGGGGGGSKATVSEHGGGGGGGGAGGCGGLHGTGGKAAGSSLAFVTVSAVVTLTTCTLASSKAGNGGTGGDGQSRQAGGAAGLGGSSGATAASGCNGGKGGDGGNGGNGSGGLGGHSLAIAASGTAPVLDDATKKATMPGAKGAGGLGGNMDADMNHGAGGIAATCWNFSSNATCD